jgi:hypothetical protein
MEFMDTGLYLISEDILNQMLSNKPKNKPPVFPTSPSDDDLNSNYLQSRKV